MVFNPAAAILQRGMTEEAAVRAESQDRNDRIRELEKQLELMNRQTAEILTILQKQDARLAEQESSIGRLDRILMELLTGRTWRTLRAAGDVVRRLVPNRGGSGDSWALTRHKSFLKCDEPRRGDKTPRTGLITVRGWCLAEGGVDCVQIIVPGLPVVEVVPADLRPDIKKAFPALDKTGRSGFTAQFDSSPVPAGLCNITLRLISQGAAASELIWSVLGLVIGFLLASYFAYLAILRRRLKRGAN